MYFAYYFTQEPSFTSNCSGNNLKEKLPFPKGVSPAKLHARFLFMDRVKQKEILFVRRLRTIYF